MHLMHVYTERLACAEKILETGWSGFTDGKWVKGRKERICFLPLYILLYDLISLSWTITGFINKKGGEIWTICGMSPFPVPSNRTSHIGWPRFSRVSGRRALNWTLWAAESERLPATHHLPGVAHVVGLLSSLPQLVYVPRQGRVHRDRDNPAA